MRTVSVCLFVCLIAGCVQPMRPASPIMIQGIKTTGDTIRSAQGTAFVVEHNGRGYMVTATHVIDGRRLGATGLPIAGNSWTIGDATAYSLRYIPDHVQPLKVGTPQAGDPAVAVGYASGLSYTVRGRVTAHNVKQGVGVMSGLILPGMSGGPVICDGKAVGVISGFCPTAGVSEYVPLDVLF